MIKREEVYKIGKLGKTHGVSGEISFLLDDDVFDRTETEYLILEIDGILVPFFMEEYRFKTDETVLMKFEGIDSQERARQLTGTEVFFPRNEAVDDNDGELSYAQLTGFTVINSVDGKAVGEIAYIDEQTANIMFELTDGTLLPAAEELIDDINIEQRTITLRIADGLL